MRASINPRTNTTEPYPSSGIYDQVPLTGNWRKSPVLEGIVVLGVGEMTARIRKGCMPWPRGTCRRHAVVLSPQCWVREPAWRLRGPRGHRVQDLARRSAARGSGTVGLWLKTPWAARENIRSRPHSVVTLSPPILNPVGWCWARPWRKPRRRYA